MAPAPPRANTRRPPTRRERLIVYTSQRQTKSEGQGDHGTVSTEGTRAVRSQPFGSEASVTYQFRKMVFQALTLAIQRGRRRRRERARDEESSISLTVTSRQRPQHNTTGDDDSMMMNSMPALYALCKCWAWEAVAFRCETHPSEVSTSVVDQNGDNVLHWVSFGHPPASVVDALLSVEPDLARMPNKHGYLPLHGKFRVATQRILLLALIWT